MNAIDNNIWTKLQSEAEDYIKSNEDYKDFLESLVLSNDDFISSISLKLSRDLSQAWSFSEKKLFQSILQALNTKDVSKAIEKILMRLFPEIPQRIPFWKHSYFQKDSQLCRPTGPLIIIGKEKLFYLIFYKAEPRKFMA